MSSAPEVGVNPGDAGKPALHDQSIRSWAERLSDADEAECQRAAEAIVQLGMELASALPALAPVLHRLKGTARSKAATELGRLGMGLLPVIARFREALRTLILTDGDETVRTCALHALAQLGPMCTSHVPALVESLRDSLPAVRAGAAQDLAQLGPEAKESVAALITCCLYDPSVAVRVHAGVALWRVGRRQLPALPALIEGLRSDDPILCWTAADCLGDMGVDAVEAVPALLEALKKKQPKLISMGVALALERIDPKVASAHGLT